MSGLTQLLLATGGTGGHIYPALAVAREARKRGIEVAVMGGSGGMEERLAQEEGLAFFGVSTGKWDRQRPDPRQALAAAKGLVDARRLARSFDPQLVIGFGGFASLPGCAAARSLSIPLVLHEGNAFPSRVNRWFASSARLFVSAQEEALRHVKARATLVVPFPVREERLARAAARDLLGLPHDAIVTLVMGGSQGSLALNRAVPDAYERLAPPKELGAQHVVLHSTGPRWFEEVAARVSGPNYQPRPYLDATAAWSAADLAITRAGVGTLSEAAFHGVPSIMVPLPTSADDHQRHNARAVEAAGAGVMVEERDVARLPAAWTAALDPAWRTAAAAAAVRRTPAGAARRIVDAVLELVN
ncbi:MAG TPA: undecaprenyldiphospho-muramoylpentapeptide beta-N-acetylglucosaminyltransferase [Trueperaceae bacterium]|nr:undecaprenyldiphospho-muramoylpentapeptide beta-N-acetylglucosaminyltransferase [Trueperaceae bacterium]